MKILARTPGRLYQTRTDHFDNLSPWKRPFSIKMGRCPSADHAAGDEDSGDIGLERVGVVRGTPRSLSDTPARVSRS